MHHNHTSSFFPRVLYILAGFAWLLLLWPNPYAVFMAACVACLTLPYFRRLRAWSRRVRRRVEEKDNLFLKKTHASGIIFLFKRWSSLRLSFANSMPMTIYLTTILAAIATPVTLFMILVAPQIGAGIARLHELWSNNFQLPPEWTEYIDKLVARFRESPLLARLIDESRSFLDGLSTYFTNFTTDTMTSLINKGFNVLGGTMTALWTIFLFLFLSVIFVTYAGRIHLITSRIFHIKPVVLHRFVLSIRQALKAVLMGVVFVAIIQGALCGVGFAVVGFKQFAFWGLLATLVAPIPMVGTALVWLPLCIQLWFSGGTIGAIGLAIWGIVFVAGADSFLRPLFLRKGIKASYLVLILVILCGIASFGTAGLILGPVLLAFSIQAMEEGNLSYPSIFRSGKVRPPLPSLPRHGAGPRA